MEHAEGILAVPTAGLVVLVGASGAGKTTFARRHFAPTEVLSSDAYRAMVSDDEADQRASAAAFDVLGRVLEYRLRRGRLSVVDATNTTADGRRSVLRVAALTRRPSVAIVFDLPEAICQVRNVARTGRQVDPAVIRRQLDGVRRTLADPQRLLAEGFSAVYVLDDVTEIDRVRVVRDPSLARPAGPSPDDTPRARASGRPLSPRRSAPRDRRP